MIPETPDRDFILDQEQWPMWPVLPMKCYRDGTESGWLRADSVGADGTVKLRVGNIYDSSPAEIREFPSIDAMLDAGWMVD